MDQLWSDDDEVNHIVPGENVKVKVKGIEEEDVSPGFVLCDANNPIRTGRIFDAQLVILEHKSIICAGYSAVMHIHCAAEEITVKVSIIKNNLSVCELSVLYLPPIPCSPYTLKGNLKAQMSGKVAVRYTHSTRFW